MPFFQSLLNSLAILPIAFKSILILGSVPSCLHFCNNGSASFTKSTNILILSGLVFKEDKENYNTGIRELEKFVNFFYDKDGFPFTRSSDDLINLLKY